MALPEAALGKLGGALHEQHDGMLGNGFADEFLDVAHGDLADRRRAGADKELHNYRYCRENRPEPLRSVGA